MIKGIVDTTSHENVFMQTPVGGLKEENALFALEILYKPRRRILLAANSLKLP